MHTKPENRGPGRPLQVLIAGGGVAGLETALALGSAGEGRLQVELLVPEEDFVYRPLAVMAPFRAGEARRFPLGPMAESAGASLRHGRLSSVDAEAHVVRTSDGEEVSFDVLVLACGARPVEAVSGALTFRGPEDTSAMEALLAEARKGLGARFAFVLPVGATWPLPLYELALLTQWHLRENGVDPFEVTLVTHEDSPLHVFGSRASDAMADLLESRGVSILADTHVVRFEEGRLRLLSGGSLECDRAVALPRLAGVPVSGIPQDSNGFVATDDFGRVKGLADVYAVGDITRFPLKQGGIAAEQADAAAGAIAAGAGASVTPTPFRPVIRGVLLTGGVDRYLRAEATGRGSTIDAAPLWWPPAKIVGRYLSPFLAKHAGIREEARPGSDDVPVEVELEFVGGTVRPLE